jgi:hypothetical protein
MSKGMGKSGKTPGRPLVETVVNKIGAPGKGSKTKKG